MVSPGQIPGGNAVVGAITGIWAWIAGVLTGVWAWLVSATSAVWTWIVTATLGVWNAVVTTALGVWGAIVGATMTAWNATAGALDAAWTGLVQFGAGVELAALVGPVTASAILLLAVALLVGGVAGSVTPMIPGGLISLAGVYAYWVFGDPQRLGLFVLVLLTIAGVLVIAIDYFSGALAARASGASTLATLASAVVGLVLFLVTGPIGVLAGTVITVSGIEYYQGQTARSSVRSGVITAGGMIASSALQLGITVGMLVLFLLAIVV